MKAAKALRAGGDSAVYSRLTRLAVDTIRQIDERIRYWTAAGDAEHVRRLANVRKQLLATYQRRSPIGL